MAIGGGLFLLGLILFIKGTRSSSKYAILFFVAAGILISRSVDILGLF